MRELDDFLGLDQTPLATERLVVFCGRSGSGKTTAIEHLLTRHPAFRVGDVVVLDEITRLRELGLVLRLLLRGERVVAASHVPRWAFLPFRLLTPTALFRTDRGVGKLARYLDRLGISYSTDALERYARRYGASYTEIDIMRELAPDTSFDRILRRFEKLHRLRRRRAEPRRPVQVTSRLNRAMPAKSPSTSGAAWSPAKSL